MTRAGSLKIAAAILAVLAIGSWSPANAQNYQKAPDVRVLMPDGISLDSDEYIPNGCSALNPCPVILTQTPYRKGGPDTTLLNAGYAEIIVDVRGTGSSQGYWDSFGADEQADGVTMVQRAATRPYSNGVVGLSGASYLGINQFLTLEQAAVTTDPRTGGPFDTSALAAVKAIFPVIPMSDAYRDVTWAGGDSDTGFIPLWLGLVNSLALVPAGDTQTQPVVALNVESTHLLDVAAFGATVVSDALLGAYEQLLPPQAQAYPDAAYDGPFSYLRSPIRRIDRINVPTFIVGGEYDIFQRGEPILYNALNLPPDRKKIVWGPWYHTTAGSTLPTTDINGSKIGAIESLQLAWFDHWLKGLNNGIENFPTVETYYIGTGKWVPANHFTPDNTNYTHFYLSATAGSGSSPQYSGTLALSRDSTNSEVVFPSIPVNGTCARSTSQWTAGLVAGTPCETNNQLTEAAGLTFTTPPATSPFLISGPIKATLFVSSTAKDLQLEAILSDAAPGNSSSNQITEGALIASQRLVTTKPCESAVVDCSVTAPGGEIIEPWHPYTAASQAPLAFNAPTELDIEIFPTFAVIEPGHSLRLTLVTADVPHMGATASTAVNSAGAINTLWFGSTWPSSIYVGVVSNPAAS